MKKSFTQLLSLLLVMVLLSSVFPVSTVQGAAISAEDPQLLTQQDYQSADDIFRQIEVMEDAPARKNSSAKQLADEAQALVLASESYVEDSLERNGNFFTWWTEDGVRCVYSPRMRQIHEKMNAPDEPQPAGAYNVPVATRGSASTEVFLIGPYYGVDDSFTDQYRQEAQSIAQAIGDADGYTLYSGTAATVDTVANAMSKGAVVIFDSHGTTDYDNGNEDYVTGAENSYLCLTSTTGLTSADYADGALYYSDGICINGATIANHMTSNNPGGILWMAICLGMATNTMCNPMRDMGVEVVYGYSQSVTFGGDYIYEECFWDNMRDGATVAEAVADMKQRYGCWDMTPEMYDYYGWYPDQYGPYYTISQARQNYMAFPIVVSDQDAHPGQRSYSSYGADSLQTVKSTYKLGAAGGNGGGSGDGGSEGGGSEGGGFEGGVDLVGDAVLRPVENIPYRLYMDKNGTKLYFNGQTESEDVSYRLDSTTEVSEAVNVYVKKISGAYLLYFIDNGIITYIRLYERTDSYGKALLGLVTSQPMELLSIDKTTGTLVYTADDGENAYYMGTNSDNTTFMASNTSNITGNHIENVDVTRFPARLEAVPDEEDIGPGPIITQQPADQATLEGTTVKFTVRATGIDLSYRWQYRSADGGSWKNTTATGSRTATVRIPATASRNGYQYRCKITDVNGKSVFTKAATLKVSSVVVTAQPSDNYLLAGKTAEFTVVVEGDGLRYQWQYRASSLESWKNTTAAGSKTDTLRVPVTAGRNGWQYRCRITNNIGAVATSKAATLNVVTLKVTAQPANKYVPTGTTAKFTVKARGTGLEYQWQYRTSAKGKWKLTTAEGCDTATLKVPATLVRSGYQYRCQITDKYGNEIYSKGATLKIVTLKIKAQPVSKTVARDKTAVFTVQAQGKGLKYQWQYWDPGYGIWGNTTATGSKTATLKVPATLGRNGYRYRCKITDSYGNVIYSKVATLKVK